MAKSATESKGRFRNRPAVCLVLSDDTTEDDVTETILQAQEAGHQVFLVDQRESHPEETDDWFGAISVSIDPVDAQPEALNILEDRIRSDGYPGVIFHEAGDPLDLETAIETLEATDEFAIEPTTPEPRPTDARVLVGIPAYNEEIGIGSTVHSAEEYADEVIVVDDGSSDKTVTIAERAGATVIEHEQNHGKGRAVRTLFDAAAERDFDVFVLIDGDGQHVPDDIPTVIEPVVDEDCDISIGSRYLEGEKTETPVYRRFGQRVLDVLTTGSARTKVTDSQSGFRAFSPNAIENLRLRTDGMGVESEMISDATEQGLVLEEVPIDVRYEGIDGQTYNPLRHGLSVMTFILQLVRDRHPLLFFGVPGLVLTMFGALYGLDGILVYQQTGNFYPAKVLVAGFSSIIGVLGIFCGLILNRISNMISIPEETP